MQRLSHKLAAMALIVSVATLPSQPAEARFVSKIAGTWQLTGTPDPGGCGPSSSFSNIASITLAGTLTNVDPVLGAGVGEAFKNGPKMYGVGFYTYLSPAPGITLIVEVQGELELINKNEGLGQFRTIVSDPNGFIPDCVYEGALEATRLQPAAY